MHCNLPKKKTAFTLIELLVVIAIIGTLSATVVVSLGTVRIRSRDIKRQLEMRQLISGLMMYYDKQGKYLTRVEKTDGTPQIGQYLPEMDDPLCSGASCSGSQTNYKWRDNEGALDCEGDTLDAIKGEWFCAYAKLEDTIYCAENRNAYMTSSHKGTRIACVLIENVEPSISYECSCFREGDPDS